MCHNAEGQGHIFLAAWNFFYYWIFGDFTQIYKREKNLPLFFKRKGPLTPFKRNWSFVATIYKIYPNQTLHKVKQQKTWKTTPPPLIFNLYQNREGGGGQWSIDTKREYTKTYWYAIVPTLHRKISRCANYNVNYFIKVNTFSTFINKSF